MQFNYRLAGIPCIIDVTSLTVVAGEGYGAPSEIDARGWVESEFDVLDTRGRPAPWLERKLTEQITANIENEIAERA
jgi:hypothetical protein